jgi:hypothetical protein
MQRPIAPLCSFSLLLEIFKLGLLNLFFNILGLTPSATKLLYHIEPMFIASISFPYIDKSE